MGASATTGSAPPPRWATSPARTRRRRRSRPSPRSRSRCRRSTGSRSGAATRPGCTSWSGPPARPRRPGAAARIDGPRRRPAVLVGRGAHPRRACWLRVQGRGRDRRARRQHRAACAPRSAADDLLARRAARRQREATVLAHTRWASVGIISEPNAHPLNDEELDGRRRRPYVAAALNGDVDNYADLKALDGLRVPAEITTDAKVIPALVARRRAAGCRPTEAFRSTVASFEGRSRSAASRGGPSPTRCSSPCAAAARRSTSAWPRTPSWSPASPTAWSRRPDVPAPRRRDPGSIRANPPRRRARS